MFDWMDFPYLFSTVDVWFYTGIERRQGRQGMLSAEEGEG